MHLGGVSPRIDTNTTDVVECFLGPSFPSLPLPNWIHMYDVSSLQMT